MSSGYYIESDSFNPYENLATEEWLLEHVEKQRLPVLFLWQNEKTIVIGRNQNVYTECNIDFVKANKALMARRKTGGGAVYHDKGNLNYSIVVPKERYDIKYSTRMIEHALNSLGIEAAANGRNDICINEMKISGNAYYSNEKVGLHHGTLLLSTDTNFMSNALNVPKYKQTYKGIKSLRSRVINIGTHYPDLSIKDLKGAIKESFILFYEVTDLNIIEADSGRVYTLTQHYTSEEWIYDRIKEYKESVCIVSEEGVLTLSIDLEAEMIQKVSIASDFLNVDMVCFAEEKLSELIQCDTYSDIETLACRLAKIVNINNWEIRRA